jgi:hypothetical protein
MLLAAHALPTVSPVNEDSRKPHTEINAYVEEDRYYEGDQGTLFQKRNNGRHCTLGHNSRSIFI